MIPNDPIERSLQAGEYVLGTLSAEERRELQAALPGSAELRREVLWWEQRLAGLGLALRPVVPRPVVWLGIVQGMGSRGAASAGPRTRFLQVWAGLATAASLLLGFGLYREQSAPPPAAVAVASYVALLQVPQSSMHWSVSLTPDRRQLVVRAGGEAPAAAAGRDAELWYIAESGPVSLGVIPRAGELRRELPPGVGYASGGTVAVSLEPPGGSPQAGPTGPVITTAQIIQAG